jgi:uncharacterized protein YfaS (alpha-2-macroglobulin family)
LNGSLWLRAGGTASLVLLLAFCLAMLGHGVTEELPVGTVQGVARMKETGRPLPNATVILRPVDPGRDDPLPVRSARSGHDGAFAIRHLAAGAYRLEAYSRAHQFEGAKVIVREAATTELTIDLDPTAPYFQVYANEHVYLPGEAAFLQAHGFSPEADIRVSVYRLDPATIDAADGRIYELMSAWFRGRESDPVQRSNMRLEREFATPIVGRDGEGVFRQDVRIEPLPEGVYYVRLACGKATASAGIFVSRIALVTKTAGQETLAFVTDLETGDPVAGAEVAQVGGVPVTTGPDGLARLRLDPRTEPGSVGIVARKGDSRAVCSPFASNADARAGALRIWHVTDRPVYRPGDVVRFKGVIRRAEGAEPRAEGGERRAEGGERRAEGGALFALPGGGTAWVRVRDPEGEVVLQSELGVGPHGSFHGEFETSTELTGSYVIETEYAGARETHWVEVAAYRKPHFKITVTPVKRAFTGRETVRMRVRAEYYFGGPVAGAEVMGAVYVRPEWREFSPDDEEFADESLWEGGFAGDFVGELPKTTTDARGEAELAWTPADSPLADDWTWDMDRRVTFMVFASEAEQYFSASASVPLAQGEYAMSLESDRYVASPGETLSWRLRLTGNATGLPVPGANVRVEYGYQDFDRRRRESRFLRDGVLDAVTGQNGEATIQLTPNRPGDFRIMAVTRDPSGNVIRAQAWTWVFRGGAGEFGGPAPDLQVVLDKKRYAVGDVAQAVVRTGAPGGHALITVEADRVYSSQVVHLAGPATVVRLPVEAEHFPNVFVTATYVKDKEFHTAQRRLVIDPSVRRMRVEVTPDRPLVEPGDEVTYTIRAAGPDGRPIAAEFALGVVDEAVYAIREDRNDPLDAFYPRRWNSVQTNYSFPELYLDGGEKGPAQIDIRRDFRDTAAWFPSVVTDGDGQAQVRVRLPDNVGAWRTTVSGVSADGASGRATSQVIARKDLMVRLNAPAQFTVGDQVRVAALVTQHTGRDATVWARLEAEGARVEGAATQQLRVNDGGTVAAYWTLRTSQAGQVKLRAVAWIGQGPSDGVEVVRQVRPHGRKVVTRDSGRLAQRTELRFTRLAGTSTGHVRVSFTPSLAGAALGSLESLIGFPYGCVEQTMNRFMPAVVVSRTLRDLGRPRPELEARIAEVARRSLSRLGVMQRHDGGFGWWAEDDSEPWTTALVLEGLWHSERAGYPVPARMRAEALRWAQGYLTSRRDRAASRNKDVYLVYACLLHGQGAGARETLLALRTRDLSSEALGLAAMSHAMLGDDARRDQAYGELMARAIEAGGGLAWSDGWSLAATPRALQAMLAIRPGDPRIDRVVAALVRQRRGFEWTSTYETAQALIGISEVLRRTGELRHRYEVAIRIGGRTVRRLAVTPENVLTASLELAMPITEFPEGDHTIEIMRTGTGGGYYALHVEQTPFEERIGQLVSGAGLSVERTYHALEVTRLEDGTQRLKPGTRAATRFRTGQPVRCRVTIRSANRLEFVVIEVPTPSNLFVVENVHPETWNWWWSSHQVFDDRIALFARVVPAGESVLEFNLRAEAAGTAKALPVDVFDMYAPDRRGSSAGAEITVVPR